MTATTRFLRMVQVVVLLALGLELPAQAAERIELRLAHQGTVETARVVLPNRAGRDLMAYGFRASVVRDAAAEAGREGGPAAGGETSAASPEFAIELRAGGDAEVATLVLSHDQRELTLPRPLGLRLAAAESLIVELLVGDDEARGLEVVVEIEIEPAARQSSRLAVRPVAATPFVIATETTSWEWAAAQSGRLLAVTGLPMERVEAIALVDVETGTILYSTHVAANVPGALRPTGDVLRLGVPVEAGRRYRLSVTLRADGPEARVARGVVAMVLPSIG